MEVSRPCLSVSYEKSLLLTHSLTHLDVCVHDKTFKETRVIKLSIGRYYIGWPSVSCSYIGTFQFFSELFKVNLLILFTCLSLATLSPKEKNSFDWVYCNSWFITIIKGAFQRFDNHSSALFFVQRRGFCGLFLWKQDKRKKKLRILF